MLASWVLPDFTLQGVSACDHTAQADAETLSLSFISVVSFVTDRAAEDGGADTLPVPQVQFPGASIPKTSAEGENCDRSEKTLQKTLTLIILQLN